MVNEVTVTNFILGAGAVLTGAVGRMWLTVIKDKEKTQSALDDCLSSHNTVNEEVKNLHASHGELKGRVETMLAYDTALNRLTDAVQALVNDSTDE
jgi:hypothetical protein